MKIGVGLFGLQAIEHQVNHGQADERFRRQDASLSVFTEPTALAQPSECSLHRPTDRQAHPTLRPLGATHDGQLPRGMLVHPVVEGEVVILGVRIHPLDSAHGLAVQLGEQLLRRLGVVHVGGRHQHGQQQPHAVHDDVAFAAVHVLGVVPAALLPARSRINRLAVHARRSSGRPRFLRRADFATEKVVDRLERTVASPLVEVTPDGAFGREVLGQVTPLTAGAENVEKGIDDLSQVGLAGPSAGMDG